MREHPDTKLIIIDTMQKIREVGGEAYSYASDYEIIGKLKQFADKHCICVLTVHHTRKQPARLHIQILAQYVCRHAGMNGIGKLGGRACPHRLFCGHQP